MHEVLYNLGYSPHKATLSADYIAKVQRPSGEIPWSKWGKTDPWDHVESAMGLTVGGRLKEARSAYFWSMGKQLPDGSWWSSYKKGKPCRNAYKDSNMVAYIATGVLHYYLVSGDEGFVRLLWPTIKRAMKFVVSLQGQEGEIYWAINRNGDIDKKALLAACSSIYMSMGSALEVASMVGSQVPWLKRARVKLGKAIREKMDLFDKNTSRYAMDWYYPVMCGVITGDEARERIHNGWAKFVVHGCGVRCVSDRPWITMAETSELVVSLCGLEEYDLAWEVFSWIENKRYKDGAYWTGLTLPDCRIFTKEKTTWTAASMILALDMLQNITPGNKIFYHEVPYR